MFCIIWLYFESKIANFFACFFAKIFQKNRNIGSRETNGDQLTIVFDCAGCGLKNMDMELIQYMILVFKVPILGISHYGRNLQIKLRND
jgi:hypothetical protein